MANRWLAIRLELLGNIVIFGREFLGNFYFFTFVAASILAIFGKESGLTAGMLGLSVSYSLNVSLYCSPSIHSNLVLDHIHVEYVRPHNQRRGN